MCGTAAQYASDAKDVTRADAKYMPRNVDGPTNATAGGTKKNSTSMLAPRCMMLACEKAFVSRVHQRPRWIAPQDKIVFRDSHINRARSPVCQAR